MLRLGDARSEDSRFARFVVRRDLPALIELYEANYVRLMNLAPDLETRPPGAPGYRHRDGRTNDTADPLGRFTLVSRVAGAMDLHLTVIDRQRYTTAVNLSYLFQGPANAGANAGSGTRGEFVESDAAGGAGDKAELLLEPNARICVYHDVRAVELVSHYRRRRARTARALRRGRMPEVERRWDANRFLGKWLRFCLHQGHLFLAGLSARSEAVDAMVREGRGRPEQQTTT